jgi:hypothetical protein
LGVETAGEHDQHALGADPVEQLRQQLQRGGIDPMDVLDDEQNRLPTREAQNLVGQMGQCSIADLLQREVDRRACLKAEQRGDEREGLFGCAVPRRNSFSSLTRRTDSVSAGSKPAAKASCCITGQRGVPV